jgi:hypothetical protein
LRDGNTSPVGTNHNPVSPFVVVVAGRVSTSPDDGVGGGVACGVVVDPAGCCADGCPLPVVEDWAEAVAAPASAATRTKTTRFNIRTRLLPKRY